MKQDKNLQSLLVKKNKQIMELKKELKHYHRSQGRYEYLYNDCKKKLKKKEEDYNFIKKSYSDEIQYLEGVIEKLEDRISMEGEAKMKFFELSEEKQETLNSFIIQKKLIEKKCYKQKVSLALFAFLISLLFLLSTLLYV